MAYHAYTAAYQRLISESRFFKLSEITRAGIDAIVDKMLKIDIEALRQRMNRYNKPMGYKVGTINLDLAGDADVFLTSQPGDAWYRDSDEQGQPAGIYFTLDFVKRNAKNAERLKHVAAHEVGHAIDPKRKMRTSDRYQAHVIRHYKSHQTGGGGTYDPIHHVEPCEADAEGTAIADTITRKFNESRTPYKFAILEDIYYYLKYQAFQGVFHECDYHINMLSTRPTALRRFKKRMFSLYQDLLNTLNAEDQKQYRNLTGKNDKVEADTTELCD